MSRHPSDCLLRNARAIVDSYPENWRESTLVDYKEVIHFWYHSALTKKSIHFIPWDILRSLGGVWHESLIHLIYHIRHSMAPHSIVKHKKGWSLLLLPSRPREMPNLTMVSEA